MATKEQSPILVDAKIGLLEEMAERHADWSEARFHRDRAGGNSAERNADFEREDKDMNALLDLYAELGFLAVESE